MGRAALIRILHRMRADAVAILAGDDRRTDRDRGIDREHRSAEEFEILRVGKWIVHDAGESAPHDAVLIVFPAPVILVPDFPMAKRERRRVRDAETVVAVIHRERRRRADRGPESRRAPVAPLCIHAERHRARRRRVCVCDPRSGLLGRAVAVVHRDVTLCAERLCHRREFRIRPAGEFRCWKLRADVGHA